MASKPIIWTIDDDPDVLRSIERDLRSQYGAKYRIMRAESGEKALDALRQLVLRGDPVALFLVDHRMPGMTGVQFLEAAKDIYPDAKRALLTAYADTDAAIQAINEVKVDYYLMKPWDPPELHLYPILDDLLEGWEAHYKPPFGGIRVIGHRWSPEAHRVKDYLARNQVSYQWIDLEATDHDADTLNLIKTIDPDPAGLPLVLFPDGSCLVKPSITQIGEKIGLRTRAEKPFYDLVIVGGGPAGLAAAVYGASEGLRTVMVEREAPGGQAGMSSRIENYLGFPTGLSGLELSRRAVAQARRFGVEMLTPQEVKGLRIEEPYRIVELADGSEISCFALLVATGVSYRKLDVDGLERLTGAGVYYGAAMTEAISCKDEDVYIVGGANSAGQAAMFFSRYARKVIMLVRASSLAASMSQYLIDQIQDTSNIEVRYCSEVVGADGDDSLHTLTIQDTNSANRETVEASSLFIFIGAMPLTDWLGDCVARDERGFILAGRDLIRDGQKPKGWKLDREPFLLESSVPGIFVAGDVRHGSVKRVASGVGEGSIAVQFVHQYLAKLQ
jgi:thioredoxin reductase (NADPH)